MADSQPGAGTASETAADVPAPQDVRDALREATGQPARQPRLDRRDAIGLGIGATGAFVGLGVKQALHLPALQRLAASAPWLERAAGAVGLLALILLVVRAVEVFLVGRLRDRASRHDLRRVVRFLGSFGAVIVALSAVFVDWTTAAVSLGLLSLILGFALQTPITSFIGWIYILTRRPYRVGDRVKIGAVTGDVMDVGYFDTTLWEFGGEYLSTDHPSGRIIKFPNSNVLQEPVWNYSWPLFPYIWNEVKFTLSYESDLKLVTEILQSIAEEELGSEMMEHVRRYRDLLARTPVDHLQVREKPAVFFRTNDMGWIDAICRYLVHPRQQGAVKTRLVQRMLERMREHPDRVGFPAGRSR